MASFDITRQLCRGDLIFSPDNITVLIKWSKTLQNRTDTITTICIPALGTSLLCPYKAISLMLKAIPGDSNDPLFRIPRANGLVPLTDSVARKHLKLVSQLLLTFHLFRKSGTTWAFQHGVSLQHIMLHGTWTASGAMYLHFPNIFHLLLLPLGNTYMHTSFCCLGLFF